MKSFSVPHDQTHFQTPHILIIDTKRTAWSSSTRQHLNENDRLSIVGAFLTRRLAIYIYVPVLLALLQSTPLSSPLHSARDTKCQCLATRIMIRLHKLTKPGEISIQGVSQKCKNHGYILRKNDMWCLIRKTVFKVSSAIMGDINGFCKKTHWLVHDSSSPLVNVNAGYNAHFTEKHSPTSTQHP